MVKKWQQAVSEETERKGREGVLRDYFGVKEGETIPTSKLKSVAARLSEKAKGEAGLSAKELRLSRQVNMALRYRGE